MLFTGREWLSDLKLYDYRNRLYQPELGRFMQPDPKEFAAGDYNLYRYCHNDPVNRVDPMGLDGFDDGDLSVNQAIQGSQLQRAVAALIGGASFKCLADMALGKIHDFAVAQGRQASQSYNNTNAGEAVRHITWVAEGTRQYDAKQAAAVADAHELGESESNQKDSARDKFNNELGPEVGRTSESPNDSAFMARMLWESGEAAQSKDDPRVPGSKDK
jgi:RHS repeat-associated protein